MTLYFWDIKLCLLCLTAGKGGSKIRELQDASGARIKVLRDDEEEAYSSSHEAKIELAGTLEVRRKAQQLIEELIYPPGTGSMGLFSRLKPLVACLF